MQGGFHDFTVNIFPLRVALYFDNPDGGGPPKTAPVPALYVPPWHGHKIVALLESYPTVHPACVQVAESASKVEVFARMIIIPFAINEPPTLFSAALAALVRSNVKFTLVGPANPCLLQLSIIPIGIKESPHKAIVFLRKSFLSIS